MVPGAVGSEIEDRCPLLLGIVGRILVRSKPAGERKIGPTRRNQTPIRKKNDPGRTNLTSQISQKAELRQKFN